MSLQSGEEDDWPMEEGDHEAQENRPPGPGVVTPHHQDLENVKLSTVPSSILKEWP